MSLDNQAVHLNLKLPEVFLNIEKIGSRPAIFFKMASLRFLLILSSCYSLCVKTYAERKFSNRFHTSTLFFTNYESYALLGSIIITTFYQHILFSRRKHIDCFWRVFHTICRSVKRMESSSERFVSICLRISGGSVVGDLKSHKCNLSRWDYAISWVVLRLTRTFNLNCPVERHDFLELYFPFDFTIP